MTATTTEDTLQTAREADLRFYDDSRPGYARRRNGKGFVYLDPRGKRVTDEAEIARINALAIPPAWIDVWICPRPDGHLQAVGRDDRGRKQYRYHERFRAHRDQTKFGNLAAFGATLPTIRQRVDEDLKARCLSREKVLAIAVHLLQTTHLRVGNDRYARTNGHYGLTTLRRKHVTIDGKSIDLHFTGKSGKERAIHLDDPKLAKALERCYHLPGYELFKYVDDDGTKHRIDAADVNEYLRETTGQDFTAKDFRTWAGTVIAAVVLCGLEPFTDEKECRANLVTAVKATAAELGNTPATCRKYYIHPLIHEAYEDGSLAPAMETAMAEIRHPEEHWMAPEEAAVLALLQGDPER